MNPEERNGRIGSRDHAQERKQHRAEMRVAKEQERKRKYEEEKAEAEMQQRESWENLEAFLNVQGFQEAERIYDACDLDYASADKKQKKLVKLHPVLKA